VTLSVADLAIVVILASAVCLLTYAVARRAVQGSTAESRQATDLQLGALAGTIKALESQVAELSKALSAHPASPPVALVPHAAAAPQQEEEISPQMLIVLAAAVTAYLGKKVRIRSAKMLQSPYEIVNPWSQQGRVIVQASHNLRSRGQ
jgi:methylmalonyl-CoA carboxyltransferase 12S subunit